jgi:hypothetical protein
VDLSIDKAPPIVSKGRDVKPQLRQTNNAVWRRIIWEHAPGLQQGFYP